MRYPLWPCEKGVGISLAYLLVDVQESRAGKWEALPGAYDTMGACSNYSAA